MKRIMLFVFATLLVNISFTQSKFDNKPYVEGEMLVQMEPNASIYDVIKKFPINLGLEVVEELSAPMRIWLVKYNQQVSSASVIQKLLYDDAQISFSEYNYYVEMR